MYICIRIHVFVYVCIRIHTCVYLYSYVYVHRCINQPVYVYVYTHIYGTGTTLSKTLITIYLKDTIIGALIFFIASLFFK